MDSGTATEYNASELASPTPNGSTDAASAEDTALTDYHSGLIALAVLIFLSNFFVIQIYKRHVKLRRNLSNVLLVGLAISDLIAGVAILPFSVYCEREFDPRIDNTLTKSCRFNYLLQNFCAFSTIFHIMAVTLEKYVAVLHPLRRMYIKTKGTYRKILATVWLSALILAFVPVFWIYDRPHSKIWFRRFYIYAIFQVVLFFGVSLVISTYCYCRMFIQIHSKLSAAVTQATRTQARVRNDRKTVVVFLMFFVIFVVGWLPWFVVTLRDQNAQAMHIPPRVREFLVSLRFVGAVLNPFVYALLKNDYKEALQSDFHSWSSKCPFGAVRGRCCSWTKYTNNLDHTETTRSLKLVKMEPRSPRENSFNSASIGHSTQADEIVTDV